MPEMGMLKMKLKFPPSIYSFSSNVNRFSPLHPSESVDPETIAPQSKPSERF